MQKIVHRPGLLSFFIKHLLYTNTVIIILFLLASLITIKCSGQISYSQTWAATSPSLGNWSSGGTAAASRSTTSVCATTGSVRANLYSSGSSSMILTSPLLGTSNGWPVTISYQYKIINFSGGAATPNTFGSFSIQYASAAAGPWITAQTVSTDHIASASCVTKTAGFTPATGSLYVRLNVNWSAGDYYFYFDEVAVSQGAAATCVAPATLSVSNLLSSSAVLNWNSAATPAAQGYDWEVRKSDNTVVASGSTAAGIVTANTGNVLLPGTSYNFYVRSKCSITDISTWSSPFAFTTACGGLIPPYTESFEGITANNTIPTCMSATNLGSKISVYTSTQASYNRFARTGTRFLSYIYSANDWVYTPQLSLTAGKTYKFSIWYITDGNTGWTTLQAKFGTAQTAAAMTGTISGAVASNINSTTYNQLTGTFTPSTSGDWYVGINCISAGTPWYLSIDDISVTELPACNTVTFPSAATAQASKTSICSEEVLQFTLGTVMPDATGITYQWKSSPDNINYINAGAETAVPAVSLPADASAKWFKCEIKCNGTTILTSAPVEIALLVQVTSITPASRCGTGSVTLNATGASGNILTWYDAAGGGTALGTGPSFITPAISASKNYYVSAKGTLTNISTGAGSPSIGSLGSTNNGVETYFTVAAARLFKSVTIYPVDAGTNKIILKNAAGTTIFEKTITITAAQANSTNSTVGTPLVVTLDWDIPAGTGYKLVWDNPGGAGVNRVLRNLGGAESYYNTNNSGITITGNNGSGTSYWFYFYNWVFTTGCGESARVPVAATINNTNRWIGGTSGNWNNPANWSCAEVPSSTANILVESNSTITLNVDYIIHSLANLTLQPNTTLIIDPNTTLTIAGTANFNGQHVIVKSTSAGTGAIGKISNPANVTGLTNVTVERYIPAHTKRAWRLLSAPVAGQTIKEAWQEGAVAAVQNPAPGYGTFINKAGNGSAAIIPDPGFGFDYQANGSSIFSYNGNAWVDVENTNNPISTTAGYFLFVRGDRNPATSAPSISGTAIPAATTLRSAGIPYTGSLTGIPVSHNFELIGNRYASAIDFGSIIGHGGLNNVKELYYVWDPALYLGSSLGGYRTMDYRNGVWTMLPSIATAGYPAATSVIESGAAFFVTPELAAGSITITEDDKVSGSNNNAFRPAAALARLNTKLYAADSSHTFLDENIVFFSDDYNNALDKKDVYKLGNSNENFSIACQNKLLVIESRKPVMNNDSICFAMWNMKPGEYVLTLAAENISMQGMIAYMADKYQNTMTPVDLTAFQLRFTVNADTLSYAANRFQLVFKNATALPVIFTHVSAINTHNNTILVQWSVEQEVDIDHYEVEYAAEGQKYIPAGKIPAKGNGTAYRFTDMNVPGGTGFYRIKSVGINGEVKYSNSVSVTLEKPVAGVSVYPNPLTGANINIRLTGQVKGKYTIRLISPAGQGINSTVLTHRGGNHTMMIHVPGNVAAGIYQLEIYKPGNEKEVRKIVVEK